MSRTLVLRAALVVGGLPLLAPGALAQCPNQWEAAPLQGLSGIQVSSVKAFDDGNGLKLWATDGGTLAWPSPHLVRWDRERWTSMGVFEAAGQDPFVYEIEVCDLGSGPSLYTLGSFDRIDGALIASIARWTGSGWAPLGSGLRTEDGYKPADPLCATVFDDGSGPQLYVGGLIETAGGTPVQNIARWDGASWSAVGGGIDGLVRALKVYDDGSGPALYAAGAFHQAGGQPASRIARWDGSTWSSVGAGCNGVVQALEVFDDGSGPKLVAAGEFFAPGSGVAAWDGSSWSTLGAGLAGPGMSGRGLGVRSEGGVPVLYVGGTFSSAGASAASNVARWDGASWSALGSGTNNHVYGFSEWSECPNGAPDLLVHGAFDSAGGEFADSIAQWGADEWRPLTPSSGADGIVYASLTWDDGTGPALYAGGDFQRIGPNSVARVGRWDGQTWSTVGAGLNGEVRSLIVWDDGSGETLYAGGQFTQSGGSAVLGVARWNGTFWEPIGAGIAGLVRALHVHDDGSGSGPLLYAAGLFTGGGHVKRWIGGAWETMWDGVSGGSSPFSSGAFSMVTFTPPGGSSSLLVGTGASFPSTGIRAWNGSAWSTLVTSSGLVSALAVWDEPLGGQRLYAGGQFVQIGSLAANYVARFDGTLWQPLGAGAAGPVWDLEVWDDGSGESIYVGGEATVGSSAHTRGVARWDGSALHAVGGGPIGTGANGWVATISALPQQDGLFVGGNLWDVLGSPTDFMAWWKPDCDVELYCVTSPNSVGAGALITTEGSTSVCASDFSLSVSGAPKNILGSFYYGPQQEQLPFGNGWRCVGGGTTGIFRLLPVSSTGSGGSASRTLDFTKAPVGAGPGQISAGSSWCFQFWYRDPAGGGSGFNLSDAVQVTFVP